MRNLVLRVKAKVAMLLPTGSLRARLAFGASWAFFGSVSAQAVIAVALILTARVLGKDDFGKFGLIRATVAMLGTFAGLGLGLTVAKSVAEYRKQDPSRAGRILSLSFVMAAVAGAGMGAAVAVFSGPISRWTLDAPELAYYIQVSSPLVVLGAVSGVQMAALAGLEAFKLQSLSSVVIAIATAPFIPFGAWYAGISGAIWMTSAIALITAVAFQPIVLKACRLNRIPLTTRRLWSERRVLVTVSLPATLSGLLVTPVAWVAATLLARTPGGFGELGVFNAASAWRNIILLVPSAVAQVALPLLAGLVGTGQSRRHSRFLRLNVAINIAVGLIVAVPIAVVSPWIMAAYGEGFSGRAMVLILSVFTAVLYGANAVLGQALASIDRVWWGFALNLLWAIELLVAAAVLRSHGAEGLATAYLLSYIMHTVQSVGCFVLVLRTHRPQDLPIESPQS